MTLVEEYRTLAASAGWWDRRARGRLRFDGRDAAAFLHALLTNDVPASATGRSAYAAWLTPQGRMIADLRIHLRADHVLADVPPGAAAALADRFDRLIFTEDVRVGDVTAGVAALAAAGPRAADAIAAACGVEAAAVAGLAPWTHLEAGGACVARTDDTALASFDLFVPAAAFDETVARLERAGARPASEALAEALRVDAGRPAFGADMDEQTIPLEAGLLDRAISLTKGCYVGQEVIVRVLHRGGGRVARRLMKLAFDVAPDAAPVPGAALESDGREVGRVTSVSVSPETGRPIGLGYLHRDLAESGREVAVGAGGGRGIARVVGAAG